MDAQWITVIKPKASLLSVDFGELWQHRNLYRMFVKRDIVTWYKQTILGSLWFFIQSIMTTDFSECLNQTSKALIENAIVFGKVYFSRLVVPLATVTSNLV